MSDRDPYAVGWKLKAFFALAIILQLASIAGLVAKIFGLVAD